MYVNGKMLLVETIPGMGKGGIKGMVKRVNLRMMYMIYRKYFCKCHKVPPPSTTINFFSNFHHLYFIFLYSGFFFFYYSYVHTRLGSLGGGGGRGEK
jgi:hypothetical protein